MPRDQSDRKPLRVGVDFWDRDAEDPELCLTEVERTDYDEVRFAVLTGSGNVTAYMSLAAAGEIGAQLQAAVAKELKR